jgi:hypothetical protein
LGLKLAVLTRRGDSIPVDDSGRQRVRRPS